MIIFKSVEDRLKEVGFRIVHDQNTFIHLVKEDTLKGWITYVYLYSTGEIEVYTTYDKGVIRETVLTYGIYKLLLKLMQKRGWPTIG